MVSCTHVSRAVSQTCLTARTGAHPSGRKVEADPPGAEGARVVIHVQEADLLVLAPEHHDGCVHELVRLQQGISLRHLAAAMSKLQAWPVQAEQRLPRSCKATAELCS